MIGRYYIEVAECKVVKYDPVKRVYTISDSEGRRIEMVKRIGSVINNRGEKTTGEIDPHTVVLALLKYQVNEATGNPGAPEGFILGGVESYSAQGVNGNPDEPKQDLEAGDQGFTGINGRRVLLRSDGTIELQAAPFAKMVLNPNDKSITSRAKKYDMLRDNTNYMNWMIHPDSEDLKNSIMQLCVTGEFSPEKVNPDIELLAGALLNLDPEAFMTDSKFPLDPGSKIALKITNPEAEQRTDTMLQVGSLADGSIINLQAIREEGVNAQVRIGDIPDPDDEEQTIAAEMHINNAFVQIYTDGRYRIRNDNTEIEGTNEGIASTLCKGSYLGEAESRVEDPKQAEFHLGIAEVIRDIISELIDAIVGAQWLTTGPGAPTVPQGLVTVPQFKAIQAKLDTLISTAHAFDAKAE